MRWHTHIVGGIATLWLLEGAVVRIPGDLFAGTLLCAAFGALLPELDATRSKIRSLGVGGIQPFDLIGDVANKTLGHRGVLHTFWGVGLCMLLGTPLLQIPQGGFYLAALVLGYVSHLLLDACTLHGIPLGVGRIRLHLLPSMLRVTTGSQIEDAVFFLLSLTALMEILQHLPFA